MCVHHLNSNYQSFVNDWAQAAHQPTARPSCLCSSAVTYDDLYQWSIECYDKFWGEVWEYCDIIHSKEHDEVGYDLHCWVVRHVKYIKTGNVFEQWTKNRVNKTRCLGRVGVTETDSSVSADERLCGQNVLFSPF